MALAFLLAHHPNSNLEKISAGAPLNTEGKWVDPLEPIPKVRRVAS